METWSFTTLVMVFGGGLIGTAFGGLWAIIFVGILVFAGCLIILGGGSDFVLLQVAFGPMFGPAVGGFLAPAAAVCYAVGIKKNLPSGTAKDVLSPLAGTSWDVLLVGGIFALFGWVCLHIFMAVPVLNQFDCNAITVVIGSLLARGMFLKEAPWGNPESIKKYGLFGTNNYAISFAPWLANPGMLFIHGLGAAILSVSMAAGLKAVLDPMVAKGTISAVDAFLVPYLMCFSIALINLIGLQLGQGTIQKVPIFHCQAVLAALGFLLTGSFVAGIICGVFGAYLQEVIARLTYNHASSHLDPPVTAIAFGTLILNIVFKPQFLNLAALFK